MKNKGRSSPYACHPRVDGKLTAQVLILRQVRGAANAVSYQIQAAIDQKAPRLWELSNVMTSGLPPRPWWGGQLLLRLNECPMIRRR